MAWWSTLLDWIFGPVELEPEILNQSSGGVALLEEPPPAELPRWWEPEGPRITEFPQLARPDLRDVELAAIAAIENILKAPEVDLPHLPQIPQRVLTLLRQDNVNFREVADVISNDQVSAAAVLRRANAADLGARIKTTALQDALTRLGIRALRALMITQSVRHLTVMVGSGKSRGEMLWHESLAAGVVASSYNACFEVCSEDAFLMGLLHDIGKVMVLRACHDAERVAKEHISDDAFEYLCQEYHERLGKALAEHWKLPREIARMIGEHHQPATEDGFGGFRAVLQLTDATVSLLGYSKRQPFDLLELAPAQYLEARSNPKFLETLSGIPSAVEGALGSL